MRHRAPRPVLARLRSFAATPRNAALALALLTAGGVAGAALTVVDAPESSRTGATTSAGPPPTDGATPTFPAPDYGSPAAGDTPDSQRGGDGAREQVERTRKTERASRSEPTPEPSPSPSRDTEPAAPAPEPSASPDPAPATSATTRSTNGKTWVIGLSSDVEGATYECSLDGGAYESCGSAVSYRDLEQGSHTFAARATSPDGATDPTPARLTADIGGKGRG